MKAVILAGGAGSRLQPLTDKRPKPLVPVGGKMCIEYVLTSLANADFRKIIITTGYLSEKLIPTLGDGERYDSSILYSFESSPAGTAGAVKKVGDFLDSTFVVASGDVLADVDIGILYDFHRKSGGIATIALTEVDDPREFGVVSLEQDGRISRFKEKPSEDEVFSNLINAGIYVMEPGILEYIPDDRPFDFSRDVFPLLMDKGEALYGLKIPGLWRDIGRPSDLLLASLDVIQRENKSKQEGIPEGILGKGVDISGPVIFGEDVKVGVRTKIVGPAYIGDGARIGRDSIIERSCIYNSVKVDRETKIVDSILLDGTVFGWKSCAEHSVLGYNCSIEDDVKLLRTILGDDTVVNKHSIISEANISISS